MRFKISLSLLYLLGLLGHFVLAGFIPKPPPYIVPGPNVKPTSNLPPMPHDLYGEPDWAHSWHQPKDEIEAVRQLDLDIQQIGLSPIIIRARLKNAGPYHVRFWGPGSPITMRAIEYGLFKIYADQLKWNFGEATQEREEKHKGLHMDDDTIIKLNPYMIIERDFVLPGNSQTNVSWHKMLENAKKVNVTLQGEWFGVRARGRDAFEKRCMKKKMIWAYKELDFKSNTIQLVLP
ncbi:Kinesin-like protein bimC [Fusarium oxysporum f. sp. albedinis]|nr:hypothetical protein FOMA001_g9223 [Fusarium oxysporum f. sp. matthiolae]KAJ0142018.1 Kinesin-like protein bimC [Fusarium oxysporum f. sp. albedinis]KAK2477376.1 hypothetical protein H9L39_09864 [Fusarium oxysporum f. sp. albedinis]